MVHLEAARLVVCSSTQLGQSSVKTKERRLKVETEDGSKGRKSRRAQVSSVIITVFAVLFTFPQFPSSIRVIDFSDVGRRRERTQLPAEDRTRFVT